MELKEVVLDIEITINNQPLSYVEDDVELPILTPNSILHMNSTYIPELEDHHIPEKDLRKRAKFLFKCKQAMLNRWTREYVQSLREQGMSSCDVIIVKEDQKPVEACSG